jgi:hypothetical protein
MPRLSEKQAAADKEKYQYHSKNSYAMADAMRRRDRSDKVICADTFLNWHRCGICSHITITGYICLHCGKDDSSQ